MAFSLPTEEHKYIFAEEMVKHVLLRNFGIYWEADSPKLPLKDFFTSCVLLGEAVTTGWKKFYLAIDEESKHIFKSLKPDGNIEEIYASLKEVAKKIDLPKEFIFFIVMAVFGELCVTISKSGAEAMISSAVAAAKRYIVDEGFTTKQDLQMNSVQFMEFCESHDDNPAEEKC